MTTSPLHTPVLFIVFNRPDTTRAVFEQIRKAAPKHLFVAADGPRPWIAEDKESCKTTREIINKIDWDCEIKTHFNEENLGCKQSVSAAIDWFFSAVEEGIILEDDCYPDQSFFPFCEELLHKYRDDARVMLIGGNNFQNGIKRGNGSYYFSHYAEIWGWASWRRAWKNYSLQMTDLETFVVSDTAKNLFYSPEERKYWYKKFFQTKQGLIDTWDYQLTYSILKNNGVAICPQVNLVKNIGLNNNPTHFSLRDSKKELELHSIDFPLIHPDLEVDKIADYYTYLQIYSTSVRRFLRLIRENGPMVILKKVFAKLF